MQAPQHYRTLGSDPHSCFRSHLADARITRSRDNFFSEDFLLVAHRFATASGQRTRHDHGSVRLEVSPHDNGDGTITIASTVTEHSATAVPTTTEAPSVTVVDGQTGTHQVNGVRFTFRATGNPRIAAVDYKCPSRYILPTGPLRLPPSYFGGDSYTFERGDFTATGFTDAGPQPPPQKGRYEVNGERIILSFDSTSARTRTFNHRIADGVHLLIDDKLLVTFDSEQRLLREPLCGFYILMPAQTHDYMDWWRSLPKDHPNFARLLPELFH